MIELSLTVSRKKSSKHIYLALVLVLDLLIKKK